MKRQTLGRFHVMVVLMVLMIVPSATLASNCERSTKADGRTLCPCAPSDKPHVCDEAGWCVNREKITKEVLETRGSGDTERLYVKIAVEYQVDPPCGLQGQTHPYSEDGVDLYITTRTSTDNLGIFHGTRTGQLHPLLNFDVGLTDGDIFSDGNPATPALDPIKLRLVPAQSNLNRKVFETPDGGILKDPKHGFMKELSDGKKPYVDIVLALSNELNRATGRQAFEIESSSYTLELGTHTYVIFNGEEHRDKIDLLPGTEVELYLDPWDIIFTTNAVVPRDEREVEFEYTRETYIHPTPSTCRLVQEPLEWTELLREHEDSPIGWDVTAERMHKWTLKRKDDSLITDKNEVEKIIVEGHIEPKDLETCDWGQSAWPLDLRNMARVTPPCRPYDNFRRKIKMPSHPLRIEPDFEAKHKLDFRGEGFWVKADIQGLGLLPEFADHQADRYTVVSKELGECQGANITPPVPSKDVVKPGSRYLPMRKQPCGLAHGGDVVYAEVKFQPEYRPRVWNVGGAQAPPVWINPKIDTDALRPLERLKDEPNPILMTGFLDHTCDTWFIWFVMPPRPVTVTAHGRLKHRVSIQDGVIDGATPGTCDYFNGRTAGYFLEGQGVRMRPLYPDRSVNEDYFAPDGCAFTCKEEEEKYLRNHPWGYFSPVGVHGFFGQTTAAEWPEPAGYYDSQLLVVPNGNTTYCYRWRSCHPDYDLDPMFGYYEVPEQCDGFRRLITEDDIPLSIFSQQPLSFLDESNSSAQSATLYGLANGVERVGPAVWFTGAPSAPSVTEASLRGDPTPGICSPALFTFSATQPSIAPGIGRTEIRLPKPSGDHEHPKLYQHVQGQFWHPVSAQLTNGESLEACFNEAGVYQVFVPASEASFQMGEVYVYPNPATKIHPPVLHVESIPADRIGVRIYDVAGGLVFQTTDLGSPVVVEGRSVYGKALPGDKFRSGVYLGVVSAEKSDRDRIQKKFRFSVLK